MNTWLKVRVAYGKNQSFDITDRIESLKYTSATEKDNSVEIRVKKDFARDLADDDRIITGNFLLFSWGVMGGKNSPVIRMKISNVEPTYAERVQLTITGTDLGNTAKKIRGNTVMNVNGGAEFASKFLIPLATKYGLIPDADQTELSSIDPSTIGAQGHMSDLDWLKKIATRNGFQCYIDNKTLYFRKRQLMAKPYRTFVYNDGNGDLIKFSPKFRETTEDSSSSQVQTSSVDPITGETKNATSNDNQDSLGKVMNKYGADAQFSGVEGQKQKLEDQKYDGARKVVVTPDAAGNQSLANKMNQDNQLSAHTASMTTLGDPGWFANTIITVGNVDRKNAGNWLATSVAHTISATGAYLCEADLNKQGSSVASKVGAVPAGGQVNKSTGPKDGTNKKTVPQYDSNSNNVR